MVVAYDLAASVEVSLIMVECVKRERRKLEKSLRLIILATTYSRTTAGSYYHRRLRA